MKGSEQQVLSTTPVSPCN